MKYILIHGSWHGAWCWKKLTPFLESFGHITVCLDLPGSGNDAHNAETTTYRAVYDSIAKTIEEVSEPVVVVAHSSAGLITAQVAEKFHHNIAHAYYISAWMPRAGYSLVDLAVAYNKSDFYRCFVKNGKENLVTLDVAKARDFLYHDSSTKDADWACSRLRPKSITLDIEKMPAFAPVHSRKKSTYILCEQDRVVNPVFQAEMAKNFGFEPHQIKRIASGHAPLLSVPEILAKMIHCI